MSATRRTLLFLACVSTYPAAQVLGARCLENGRFYRDPDAAPGRAWAGDECARYFLCLENEVFEFKCSVGLLFDVDRQICDFKANVDNCDVAAEASVPKPLLEKANCEDYQLGCADGTCLPEEYFCDGSTDCADGSDEADCNPKAPDNNAATACDAKCKLPDCFCSIDGTSIPAGLNPLQVPQMVLLTFDDAVNSDNYELYDEILNGSNYTNPNGCPIAATFFISHQYNNYYQTQKLWNAGHEIAVHSITHRGPEDWWSLNATVEDYFDEMVGQANILHKYASVRLEDIKGLRVPFLRVGWNRQFLMAKEFGFLHDNTIVAPFNDPPYWPYSLDHKIPHECQASGQLCPTRPYPGLWELPINQLIAKEFTCTTIDNCPDSLSSEEVYKMLHHNFKRHYLTNRAPFGLHLRSSWFKKSENVQAFTKFIEEILEQPDVWLITSSQAIDWMRKPTPINKLESFAPWDCITDQTDDEMACTTPNACKLYSRVFQQERIFHTCAECPPKYPWIRNEIGLD